MVGIYKITNRINGKVYIGQSIHIKRRWQEHCRPSTKSIISDAIKKYGKENFSFEIIEECNVEELNEKEAYYIESYNSLTPNGYNIIEKNDMGYNSYHLNSKEKILKIIHDIKETELTFDEIGNKFNVSSRTIYSINKGEVHHFSNEQYPLREIQNFPKKYFCIDCGKLISNHSVRCVECDKKHRRTSCPLNREELKQLIRTLPFTTIGKQFNVSDNAIRKWCTWFNLPYRKKDINSYSDKEWEKI